MLTQEQNDSLTQVSSGTPMGDLMRRYWHPIAASAELTTRTPKAVRLLGEALVLFRTPLGGLGLVADACAHRGASLACGMLDDRGLRCAVHHWLYAPDGRCLEQPMEPIGSDSIAEARTTAYSVQELGGLIFAYLGGVPEPLLPRYNVLVWDDAMRETNGSIIPCNWLQVMENLLDPVHVEYLHGRYFADVLERRGGSAAQDFRAHHYPPVMKRVGFDRFDGGIIERHVIASEADASWRLGTPSFFPTTSLVGSAGNRASIIFIVPIDDTHTWFLLHMAERTGRRVHQQPIPFSDVPGTDASGRFLIGTANGQDHMAVVTQGDIAARAAEHLGTSDAGIVLYRELLTQQLERLQRGEDPINVRRSPAQNRIINGPEGLQPAGADDVAGWSRQRRRRAARQVAGAQR